MARLDLGHIRLLQQLADSEQARLWSDNSPEREDALDALKTHLRYLVKQENRIEASQRWRDKQGHLWLVVWTTTSTAHLECREHGREGIQRSLRQSTLRRDFTRERLP